ncbi:MAG: hypothetical protein ACTSRZ_19810 [Promethearchaeota archaeon]
MDYKAKYIRTSIVKELFVHEGTKIRISAEAKPLVFQYLDNKVEEAVKELIAKLPTKSKGEHKGELKRITILPEDLQE